MNTMIKIREVSYDGIMPDRDVVLVTGLSKVTLWRLERQGMFPKRVQLSPGRVGRIGREVKAWLDSRPRVGHVQPEMEFFGPNRELREDET